MKYGWVTILQLLAGRAGVLFLFIFMVAIVAGCISKPDGLNEREKSTAATPTEVPPEPRQIYIKTGQFEQFTYRNHNITIHYSSAYPVQILKVTVNGIEKEIQKNVTDGPAGIYWKEESLSFALKPVTWEMRDGQRIPFYEKTWNTTELYFEVFGGVK